MPSKDFEDKRLEGRNKEKDLNHPESGENSNRSDKKLLLGTVQFYEDILFSLSKSLIIVYNKLFTHIQVWGNSDIEDLYGIKINEFQGKVLTDVFSHEIAEDLKNQIINVFETGRIASTRINVDFPNGNFWLEVTLTPLVENNENTSAVIGYFRDISEVKGYEKELISIREKVRNLVELSPECLLTANLKGVISSANFALAKITGFKEEELIGKKITRLPNLKSQDISRFQAIIDIVNNNEIPPSFEFEWVNREGSLLWCEVRVSKITKNNKLSGFQVIFNEITERKLIEKDLLKSKQAYKVIIENSHEAIFIIQDNHIKFCNSRFIELLNCSMDELLRTPFDNFVHPQDKRFGSEYIARKLLSVSLRANCLQAFCLLSYSSTISTTTPSSSSLSSVASSADSSSSTLPQPSR